MPYVYIGPDMYLEHRGIEVFHVYRGGTDEPWGYWFTTDPETADDSYGHGDGGHFDARRFAGRWSETPTVDQWDEFWKPRFKTEDDAIQALIRTAIEEGKLGNRNSSAGAPMTAQVELQSQTPREP